MIKSWPKYIGYLFFSLIIIIVDQITKQIAYDKLLGVEPIDVMPILQWALVFNRGAAFGFLSQAGGFQHYLFSGLAISVSLVLVVWLWRIYMQNTILAWGLVLVLAGAIGNLIDRLRYQYVIDFINFHYQDWYFPAFNIADMSISLGAILLILDALGFGGEQDKMHLQ